METKGWDVFRTIPPEQESGSEAFDTKYIGYTVKFLKVLAYIVCFLVVLGGSVISKATVLFMTSQIRPQKSILHCNLDLERDKSYQAEIPANSKAKNQTNIHSIISTRTSRNKQTENKNSKDTISKPQETNPGVDKKVPLSTKGNLD